MIPTREISAVEAMTAFLDHIEQVNGLVPAIISLRFPRNLLNEAAAADMAVPRGEWAGLLHGVPHAIKDSAKTKGLQTTYGSPM
ncbi:MAG: amidase, partial [Mesorhizobium sp.]